MKSTTASSDDDEGEQEQSPNIFLHSLFILFFTGCYQSTGDTANMARHVSVDPGKTKPAVTSPPGKKKKTIYLTFDDGPNKGTRHVLQVLTEEQVPAGFFVIGEHVYGSRDQQATWDSLQQNEWVEIYNHSYTHAQHNHFEKFYTNDSAVISDFQRCSDSLHLNNKLVRMPGRNSWRMSTVNATDIVKSKAAADSLYNAGFIVVGWDVEWRFNDSMKLKQTSDEMINEIDSVLLNNHTKTPDHVVLLTHDQLFKDSAEVSSLQKFIRRIKSNDEYRIEFVSKYPGAVQ